MGIRSALAMRGYQSAITAALDDPSLLPYSSPWSDQSHLNRLAYEDFFGRTPLTNRAAAMRLGPVARGRNLMVSTISRLPLVALGVGESVPARPIAAAGDYSPEAIAARDAYGTALREFYRRQPTWLYRTDDGSSPLLRLAHTIDDLMFYGVSCWWRRNGSDKFPLTAGRINQDAWAINADNRIEVDGVLQDDRDVILIPGLHEGILRFGQDVLADAKALNAVVRDRIKNPVPQIDLHQTGGKQMTADEQTAMKADWSAARQGENGGVAYTNQWIEAKEFGGGSDSSLMIEARNAAALELARIIGVSANRLDATSAKASLNYETTTGRNQEFVDFDLALYMAPITARLSLDDCVPMGTRVEFDLSDFIDRAPSVSGPNNQD